MEKLEKIRKHLRRVAIGAAVYSATAFGVLGWPRTGVFALACGILLVVKRMGRQDLWSHGRARWVTKHELRKAGMIGANSGLILGKLGRDLVRLPQAVHTAVYAPSGVGKAVSMIFPFILTCNESMFIVDFKLELYPATFESLKNRGFEVILLSPFTKGSHLFNALSLIDPNSIFAIDDCKDFAKSLVVRTGEEQQPHFSDYAEIVIGGVAATGIGHGENPSPNLVREIASDKPKFENTRSNFF